MQLLEEIRKDTTVTQGVSGNRAPQEILKYVSQYTVPPDQVDERLADMMNTVGMWSFCVDLPRLKHSWTDLPRKYTIQAPPSARIKS